MAEKGRGNFVFSKHIPSGYKGSYIVRLFFSILFAAAGWAGWYYVTSIWMKTDTYLQLEATAGYDIDPYLNGFMLLFAAELTVLIWYLLRRYRLKLLNYGYLYQLYEAGRANNFEICPFCGGEYNRIEGTGLKDTYTHTTYEMRDVYRNGDKSREKVEVKHYNRRFFKTVDYLCPNCHCMRISQPPKLYQSTGVCKFWKDSLGTFGAGKLILLMIAVWAAVAAWTLYSAGIL